MLDALVELLAIAFVAVLAIAVAGFFILRWLFVRTAEGMARRIDRGLGGVAAHAVTRLAAYARATGIDVSDADRRFGLYIDRLARLMDSAVHVPGLGPVGLDAVLGLVPGVGDIAGAVLSLVIVARSLRYGPPPALVSKMLANVLTDTVLGAIPLVGILADVWFRANDRNAALMREYLAGRPE